MAPHRLQPPCCGPKHHGELQVKIVTRPGTRNFPDFGGASAVRVTPAMEAGMGSPRLNVKNRMAVNLAECLRHTITRLNRTEHQMASLRDDHE